MMLRLGTTHRGAQETALPSVFEKEEITDEKDFGMDYGHAHDCSGRVWQSAGGGIFFACRKREGCAACFSSGKSYRCHEGIGS